MTANQADKNYGAAFTALRSARQATMFFRRAELLLKAARLYRSIGDLKLASRLEVLATISSYGAFREAANG